jgi:ketosteroid isomerase-like protein
MELWELAAREAIRETVAAYAHHVDGGRFDELVALFTPDGVLEVVGGERAEGTAALRAFFTGVGHDLASDRAAVGAGEAAPAPRVRHHVSNLRITFDSPHQARAQSYFLCVTDHGVDHWGRYRDRLVATGSTWRFAWRTVRTDGALAHGWAARRGHTG